MKKILSFILAAAMLLSMIIVVSIPTAAIDGQWTTYTKPSDYGTNDDSTPKDPVVAGYKYTSEGFTTVDADWTNRSPFVTAQTKNTVSLKDGIYLKVRVDRFAYEGNDSWINLNIWDSQNIEPGKKGNGQGIQTLIRPTRPQEQVDNNVPYDESDWCYEKIQWWGYEWTNAGETKFTDADGETAPVSVVNGEVIFELELKFENDKYTLTINGTKAPSSLVSKTRMNELFPDGEAYVGITLHNSTYDSVAGLTILEFGTSKDDAMVPDGDDEMDPKNATVEEIADIADAGTVPAGQPAILMTGNKEASDTKSIAANQGDAYTIDDDYTVRVSDTNADRWNSTVFKVKNDVSHDIDDFPVMMFLTKNYCTCEDPELCYAAESCNTYIMAGKGKAPASGGCMKIEEIDVCWAPIVVEEGDKAGQYLYFWYDTSSEGALALAGGEGSKNDWTGRIHGVQMEFNQLSTDATRNVIPIVWVAFFRTVEEGEAYIASYLNVDVEGGDTGDVETNAPVDNTTEAVAGDTTEAVAGDTTEAVAGDTTEAPAGETTEAAAGETTEAKGKDKDDAKDDEDDDDDVDVNLNVGGCGSAIGAGAVAVVALVSACGAVVLKKKED